MGAAKFGWWEVFMERAVSDFLYQSSSAAAVWSPEKQGEASPFLYQSSSVAMPAGVRTRHGSLLDPLTCLSGWLYLPQCFYLAIWPSDCVAVCVCLYVCVLTCMCICMFGYESVYKYCVCDYDYIQSFICVAIYTWL